MADREELREQLAAAVRGADYPVHGPMDLVPALSDGPWTRFESGEFSATAMELSTDYRAFEFPYESAEELVEDVLDELADQGAV